MGLDNLPNSYPCKERGTAVLVDERIDCRATQQAGGCPWQNANPPVEGRVLGMLGTDCWYRGKWGNALLEKHSINDPMGENFSFFGDNEDGTIKTVASCISLADFIKTDVLPTVDELDDRNDLIYAEWYLRWSAENCDGLVCWY